MTNDARSTANARPGPRRPALACLLAITCSLVACGSGGSSEPASTPPVTSPPPTGGGTQPGLTIVSPPTDAQVNAGAQARFSVALSADLVGSGATLQWQRSADAGLTWQAIPGAAATTLELPGTLLQDNGLWFRVQLTQTGATTYSAAARLTVLAVSPLLGRTWTTGQSLEENTSHTTVQQPVAAIADQGQVTVLFIKNDGTRDRVYAVHGSPQAGSLQPAWTTPQAIDGNTTLKSAGNLSVTSAPNGNAVALWSANATCTANTYLGVNGLFDCKYFYTARYDAASGTWGAPTLLTDSDTNDGYQTWFNNRGDLVFMGQSWVPGPPNGARFFRVQAVFMQASGETGFRRQVLSEQQPSPFETVMLDMDDAGRLLMGARLRGNGVADIVAYRGTVANGFDAPILLEDSSDDGVLAHVRTGRNGQQMVAWHHVQDQSARAATSASPSDTFVSGTVLDTTLVPSHLVIDDSGRAFLFSPDNANHLTWTATQGWTAVANWGLTDSGFTSLVTAVSRNGLVLRVDGVGQTAAYDMALRTTAISAQSPATARHVVGVSIGTLRPGTPLLAVNGIGFVFMHNDLVTLPTATNLQGVVHPGNRTSSDTSALWGAYLR